MRRNARRLVKKLGELGYIVHGASFHIGRNRGQPMMNKAAGEMAPCWKLLVNPLWQTTTGIVVDAGSDPIVDFPDGVRQQICVYSYYPLLHILKTSIKEWEVDIDQEERLCITTAMLPDTW